MQTRISVRNLVEFILRSGDIDNRRGGMADKDAMALGSRIHRKIQKSMGARYRAEVPLATEIPYEDLEILVEGRADGIIGGDEYCIDEIKGIFMNPEHLTEPIPVHLAQAKCYAWIYGSQNNLEHIDIQMTYVNLETEEIRRFRETYLVEELGKWFRELVNAYYPWAHFKQEWRKTRNASAGELAFPFSYREGQKKVAAAVYHTIAREKKLFLMAPTGVGKTMAVLFPSVKALGEELGETIFYLTAKTITRTVAEKALNIMREKGLKLKSVTLTAKEKICLMEEPECNPEACPYAKGHYDRVNEAVYDLLTHGDACSRELIIQYAKNYNVCPFEMSLDLSLWMDTVICDYNYLFDPNAHLRRFFSDGVKGKYLFLIDEAHNLVDRGREMYSASICKEDFLELRKTMKSVSVKIYKQLTRCNELLLEYKRECETYVLLENLGNLPLRLYSLMSALEEFLEDRKNVDSEIRKKVLEFYFKTRDFVYIYELYDENYVIYSKLEKGNFYIRLFCVNPARNLSDYLGKGVATIYFSATFLPIRYYQKLLSTDSEDFSIYAESPFPTENRFVGIGNELSSRYTMRSPRMYKNYAEFILRAVKAHPGNYMVFFPSYAFLDSVKEELMKLSGEDQEVGEEIQIIFQESNMTEARRDEFLEKFKKDRNVLGLCVMGGIFGEGIDLTDDALIGAFIVGTGLPQVCDEREILKNYFDRNGENGFQYAYLFSGMNRVLQAAGRVIRTDTDRGVVFLLDERFLGQEYRKLFPREWKNPEILKLDGMEERLNTFWGVGESRGHFS